MHKDIYSRITRLLIIGQVIITIYLMGYVIYRAAFNEVRSLTSLLFGIALATAIALLSFATSKGSQWLERLSDWLTNQLKIYPTIRRFTIAPGVASAPLLVYWAISNMQGEATLKVFVAIYFGIILPSAIVSLVIDDRAIEKSPLAKHVSRETFTQNSQAALAQAFTVMEQRLKEKIGGETKNYGRDLINEAYQGETSKLVFVSDGKDRTSQLRDLMAGAYSLLRNPRHHTIIDDDEHTALAIFSLTGLLLNFVDASELRKTHEGTTGS